MEFIANVNITMEEYDKLKKDSERLEKAIKGFNKFVESRLVASVVGDVETIIINEFFLKEFIIKNTKLKFNPDVKIKLLYKSK